MLEWYSDGYSGILYTGSHIIAFEFRDYYNKRTVINITFSADGAYSPDIIITYLNVTTNETYEVTNDYIHNTAESNAFDELFKREGTCCLRNYMESNEYYS